jgi:hypothetical protein
MEQGMGLSIVLEDDLRGRPEGSGRRLRTEVGI